MTIPEEHVKLDTLIRYTISAGHVNGEKLTTNDKKSLISFLELEKEAKENREIDYTSEK